MSEFTKTLAIECWTLWSVTLILMIARLTARRIHLKSFSKFQADDYTMMFTLLTYTSAIVVIMQVGSNGSNYIDEEQALALTPEEAASAIWGSKMSIALEEFVVTTVWLVKACMLTLYHRLTKGLWERRLVYAIAGYCIFGYILIQVFFLGVWCRPFNGYWALPVQHEQCASYANHMIMVTIVNLSSDVMMLCIYLPILINSKLPLKRKLLVTGVFSLGVFVIIIAVLNRVLNFTLLTLSVYLKWNVAEISTAVYVANIILCWPLILRLSNRFSKNRSSLGTNPSSSQKTPKKHNLNSRLPTFREKTAGRNDDEAARGDPMWNAADTFMERTVVAKKSDTVIGEMRRTDESSEVDTLDKQTGVETVAMAGAYRERESGLSRGDGTITKSVHITTRYSD